MLNKLTTLLQSNSLYIEKELKDFDDTTCPHSNLKFIAFDEVKDNVCKIFGIPKNYSSVDLVFLNNSKNTIYLIEMKRFDSTGSLSLRDFIEERMKCMSKKTIETMFVLLIIMGYYNIEKSFYHYFLNKRTLKIKSCILTNMSDVEYVTYNLAYQDKFNITLSGKNTNCMESEIKIINCNSLPVFINS